MTPDVTSKKGLVGVAFSVAVLVGTVFLAGYAWKKGTTAGSK